MHAFEIPAKSLHGIHSIIVLLLGTTAHEYYCIRTRNIIYHAGKSFSSAGEHGRHEQERADILDMPTVYLRDTRLRHRDHVHGRVGIHRALELEVSGQHEHMVAAHLWFIGHGHREDVLAST